MRHSTKQNTATVDGSLKYLSRKVLSQRVRRAVFKVISPLRLWDWQKHPLCPDTLHSIVSRWQYLEQSIGTSSRAVLHSSVQLFASRQSLSADLASGCSWYVEYAQHTMLKTPPNLVRCDSHLSLGKRSQCRSRWTVVTNSHMVALSTDIWTIAGSQRYWLISASQLN